MNHLSCLIIDDEPYSRKLLEKYVAKVPGLEALATCSDAMEAMSYLQKQAVDLIFLDIHMPGLSGIQLLQSLSYRPMVIFTTAYPEYAVEGFELAAIDYLVKPFSFERFLKACNRAFREKQTTSGASQAISLLLKADKKLHQVAIAQIRYLQAYGDYVKVFTSQGLLVPKIKLSDLEAQIPKSSFLRIHRSFIVALSAIEYIEGNQLCIDGQLIPIAQSYREALLQSFHPR
ncbi:MAG: response regulator transcription factor [Bacteroidota bacterium]